MPNRLDEWLELIQERHPGTIELGLDRCSRVWRNMGQPRPAARVFTVAGTNGKGSTVAGIESGLASLGLRVGSYTSPHLLRYNERIRILGQEASDEAIIAGFEAVEAALGEARLTYFEAATLAAFSTMAEQDLDCAVLEVGLGGRLDAVNLIDADVAIITPIGIDHQEYLGTGRESIGREKAGIMRSGQVVVCGDRDPPESVLAAAETLDARLVRIGVDFDVSRTTGDETANWRYLFADLQSCLPIAMSGDHQADNLASALTAVILGREDASASIDRVATAVAACRVRGRLERFPGSPEVVVDVGHNPLAAAAVADFLDRLGASQCHLVLGMLSDKDAGEVAAVLGEQVSAWYCAGLSGPRGQTGEELASRVRAALPNATVGSFDAVSLALEAALTDATRECVVVAMGSFLTASEAIMHLEARS